MASKKVTFTVGLGLDKDGHSISYHAPQWKQQAFKRAADVFGGYTVTEHTGGWISPTTNTLVTEPSMSIVVCISDLQFGMHDIPRVVRPFAQYLATLFNQESVLLAIEPVDSLEFITQPTANKETVTV